MFLHSNNVTCLLALTNLKHRHQSILFWSTSIDQLAEHRKSAAYQPRSNLPFSWEAFFKDNLLEWCEWDITILSRIEHFLSPSTSPFECTWDPNRRHWKKQTWEWKGFSRIVGDILPSHFSSKSTSLLNSGAYCNHRARNMGQLMISSQVDAAHTIKIVFG